MESVLKIVICVVLIQTSHSKLSCKNEIGENVDWFIVYKLPQLHNSAIHNSFVRSGESYVYLSVDNINNTGKWILSSQSISSPTSVIGRTLNPVILNQEGIAYLLYNDEVLHLNESKLSSQWGHTKGILAFDDDTGYWLIHSIPKFPSTEHYYFPNASKEHGQIFICVTYNFSTINEIGEQLRYMHPQIYKYQWNKAVLKLSKEVQSLFSDHHSFIHQPPWYRNVSLISRNGIKFISFSKHAKFNKDLYSEFVAPVLQTPLYTETWLNGKGLPLPSVCDISYPVWNIKELNISIYYMEVLKSIDFHSSIDHSKWAVSTDIEKRWTCIGDINRMKSQEKRGGGTMCFKSEATWEAFRSSVEHIQQCPYDGNGFDYYIKEEFFSKTYLRLKTPKHFSTGEKRTFDIPNMEKTRKLNSFVLCYDRRWKIPAWVYEVLTKDSLHRSEKINKKKMNFLRDRHIHPYFQSLPGDYSGSSYSKGHLAAAANHPANEETFRLSNVAPQVGYGFNNGIWKKLEAHVRRLAKREEYISVRVCTGSLFLAKKDEVGNSYVKYKVIGPNQVAVPTHFFKFIVAETVEGLYDLEAYIIENTKHENEDMKKLQLQSYQVPINTIEREAGILFNVNHIQLKKIRFVNNKKNINGNL